MRRFLAGLMIGLIVLTGIIPVTPHDDFGPGHAHAGSLSAPDTIAPDSDNTDTQDERNIVHCNGIAHFYTAIATASELNSVVVSQAIWRIDNVLVTHITAPATPPPIS